MNVVLFINENTETMMYMRADKNIHIPLSLKICFVCEAENTQTVFFVAG